MTDPTIPLCRSASVMHSDLGDKTVMMDLENGSYYGLNTVGARIWSLLEEPISISDLCEQLQTEFEVEPDACTRAVTPFVEDLVQRGVLVPTRG